MPYDNDPFSQVSVASLSWKDLPIGTIFTCEVLEGARLLQSRDFDTNLPAFWDVEKQRPRMSAVLNVRVVSGPHSVGEERSIWAQQPSSLFVAIAQAQKAAGQQIAAGGVLSLAFVGEVPHENKRFNAIKQYQAKYEPPAGGDAFSAKPPPPPGTQTWRDQARQKTAPAGYPSHQTAPAAPAAPVPTPATTPTGFKW